MIDSLWYEKTMSVNILFYLAKLMLCNIIINTKTIIFPFEPEKNTSLTMLFPPEIRKI